MTSVIEFFCGIGGLANCLPPGVCCTGIDISGKALEIYQRNFGHPVICKTIESLSANDLPDSGSGHDLWWMSPPCQPHTRQGLQQDLNDRRSAAFVNLVGLIQQCRPRHVGLENVAEFADSDSLQLLTSTLRDCGYQTRSLILCPGSLGGINRRRRFYLIASQAKIEPWRDPLPEPVPARLEETPDWHQLSPETSWLSDYRDSVHIVDRDAFMAGEAMTRCFTSAYGRSPLRSGSWLADGDRLRLFSPREILWQLGFPTEFYLPSLPCKRLWPVVGNSLSRAAVGYVLRHLPLDRFEVLRPFPAAPPVDVPAES